MIFSHVIFLLVFLALRVFSWARMPWIIYVCIIPHHWKFVKRFFKITVEFWNKSSHNIKSPPVLLYQRAFADVFYSAVLDASASAESSALLASSVLLSSAPCAPASSLVLPVPVTVKLTSIEIQDLKSSISIITGA